MLIEIIIGIDKSNSYEIVKINPWEFLETLHSINAIQGFTKRALL